MKTTKILIALLCFLLTVAACKKETKSQAPTTPPANNASAVTTATTNLVFFIDADKYQVREPITYPFGSPDIVQTFSVLGTQNQCTTTGAKIVVKYYSTNPTDTTQGTYWFFKNANLVGQVVFTLKGNGKLKNTYFIIAPTGAHMDTTCTTKTIVFN